MSEAQRDSKILPVECIFSELPRVDLPDFYARLASCGAEIYLDKLGLSFEPGTRIRLFGKSGFFALGEVYNFDAGPAIKPIKQFLI